MRHVFMSTASTRGLDAGSLWSGPRQGAELDGLARCELPLLDPG